MTKKTVAEQFADARRRTFEAAKKAAPHFPEAQIGEATLTLLRRGETLTFDAVISELERRGAEVREELRPFWQASIDAMKEASQA